MGRASFSSRSRRLSRNCTTPWYSGAFQRASRFALEIGKASAFPVILKPARSKILVGNELRTPAVVLLHDEIERREQLQRWLPHTPVLQQQYVFGRGIGIEFLYRHGRKVWHFAHERVREFPLSGGASSYRRSIQPPEHLLADAQKLLDHLSWHGVAVVEFKVDEHGRHWLMEINPRLWGSLALAIDAGVDFPLGLLGLARGEAPLPLSLPMCSISTREICERTCSGSRQICGRTATIGIC